MPIGEKPETSVSYNELLVLQAMASGCHYGFEIMAFTDLSAGTVYPMLRRFEVSGLVESSKEDAAAAHARGRPPRRMHVLRASGRSVLISAREALISRQREMGLIPPERSSGK
ncbi:MAG: hypothetical protein AMXMBFR53_26480 [Gemmatimonadota bacterium]